MKRPLGMLLLATALAACARPAARTAAEGFQLDAFRWRAETTPQQVVIATNEWGDLRVRTADRGGLVVGAMIQKIGTLDEELAIRIDEGSDRVVVQVVPRVRKPRGRVDLTLMVPAGKRLEATTRAGLAEIKYRGDVLARTRSGDITLVTPAHGSARSETGNIDARLSGAAWLRPLEFASGSGDITIWVPDHANLVLRAETAGAIDLGRSGATLGDGGAELCIDSVRGDVRVVQYGAGR